MSSEKEFDYTKSNTTIQQLYQIQFSSHIYFVKIWSEFQIVASTTRMLEENSSISIIRTYISHTNK